MNPKYDTLKKMFPTILFHHDRAKAYERWCVLHNQAEDSRFCEVVSGTFPNPYMKMTQQAVWHHE